jgi:hypothetical protein
MARESLQRFMPSRHLRILVVVLCLLVLAPRKTKAEDRVDLTLGYYLEDHARVEVWSPGLLWETNLSERTTMRVQGIYDVVSGASPTGAPMTYKTKSVTRFIDAKTSVTGIIGFNAVAGPTPMSGGSAPIYGTITSTKKVAQTVLVPYGKPFLPMQSFDDQRIGVHTEIEHRERDWVYTGGIAYGNESDYESLALSGTVAREFNEKATIVSLSASLGRDWVLNPGDQRWEDKDIIEGLVSVAQTIDRNTQLTISGTLGQASGYLDDQYKYASVDDLIVHENRPGVRDKRIAFLMLNHCFEKLNGSLEASYRFYNDSFGIDAHTLEFAWYQNLGKHWVVAPSLRWYSQSAADFYATKFTGKPEFYSADYRLSKLTTVTYGLKLVWKPTHNKNISLSYDRYEMDGRDGVTPGEAYPKANMLSLGVKLWY